MIKLVPLIEKTYNITQDVNYVYEAGLFKIFIDTIKKQMKTNNLVLKYPGSGKVMNNENMVIGEVSSVRLSPDAKKAHELNPIKIYTGVFPRGSYYDPKNKIILISVNRYVIRMLTNREEPSDSEKNRFYNEISEKRIKSTISHELSHWISDSLHNQHIKKITGKADEFNSSEILKLGKKDVNMTYFELDAQIHGIKALKSKYKNKTWDAFTLLDIFNEYTALHSIANTLYRKYGQDVLDIWQKDLIKRLNREGLLGKNMKHFIKGNQL